MHREFHQKFGELLARDAPFIVATVIGVRGSAVAKPGAKAIIDEDGRPVFGWVGGGCVESFVCAEAREALREREPRVITADLEDELSGVGLPCGGVMQIFIEPVLPRRRVKVFGKGALADEASRILERAGFNVTRADDERGSLIIATDEEEFSEGLPLGGTTSAEIALGVVAKVLATTRRTSARPLQEVRMGLAIQEANDVGKAPLPSLVIIGHSGITEEIAWLAHALGWKVFVDSNAATAESYPSGVEIVRDDASFSRLPVKSETAVIVATHHKGDHFAIERGLSAGAWYVGLVASAHRSGLVREMLKELMPEDAHVLQALRTPAGLDLGARTPAEIAVSIMSEVLACFHNLRSEPLAAPPRTAL